MGVKGLWTLLDPVGKPVTLESLEGRILAVDVSIWLHHFLHGMRDRRGDVVQNAHLIGLFMRICKLLFYKIRPVFVFDGGVPELKRQTLAARRQVRNDATERSEEVTQQLLTGLLKRHAVNTALYGPSTSSSGSSQPVARDGVNKQKKPDMFELAPLPETSELRNSATADVDRILDMRSAYLDVFAEEFQNPEDLDINSEEFTTLPAEIRYELLNEMRENRKNRRRGCYSEMPDDSENFSKFQLSRMMRRSELTTKLDGVRKEINAQASGAMVEGLTGQAMGDNVEARRMVSSDSSHYILIKGLSKQLQEAARDSLLADRDAKKEPTTDLTETKAEKSTMVKTTSHEPKVSSTRNRQSDAIFTPEIFIDDDLKIKGQKKGPDVITLATLSEAIANTKVPDIVTLTAKPDTITIRSDSDSDCVNVSDIPPSKVQHGDDNPTPDVAFSAPIQADYSQEGGFIREDSSSEEEEAKIENKLQDEVAVPWESRDFTSDRHEIKDSESETDEEAEGKERKTEESQLEEESPSASGLISDDEPNDKICLTGEGTENVAVEAGVSKNLDTVPTLKGESIELKDDVKFEPSEQFPGPVSNEVKIILDSGQGNGPEKVEEVRQNIPVVGDSQSDVIELSESTKEEINEENGDQEITNSEKNGDKNEISVAPGGSSDGVKGRETEESQEQSDAGSDDEFIEIPTAAQLELRSESAPEVSQIRTEEEDSTSAATGFTQNSARGEYSGSKLDAVRMQELLNMDRNLVIEADRLQVERGRLDRQAASINDQIMAEAQELLRLFGLPYIVSPKEAEAQCAELDSSGQTQGTITDDSDIWLFGGTKVYKNMFNQGKYVEFYNINSIKSQLMLDRESLITMAYLCGSDYTPGVAGVGPVTALELLAEFPASSGFEKLRRLKSWWNDAKRSTRSTVSDTKAKAKLRKLKLKPGFPSKAVWEAYMKPEVDREKDKFSWEKPDLDLLRHYALEKFGWSQNKTDEALLPVIKRLNEMSYQKHITSFFSVDFEPKKPKSKRVKNVLDRLQGKTVTPEETVKEKAKVKETNTSGKNVQPRKRIREDTVEEKTQGGKAAKIPKQGKTLPTRTSKVGESKSQRGKGKRSKGEPLPKNQIPDDEVNESGSLQCQESGRQTSQAQGGQGSRGRGQRGRGGRGRPRRGRGIVLAQKQQGGSYKVLHCPNKKNVVEEVNLSESSSSDED